MVTLLSSPAGMCMPMVEHAVRLSPVINVTTSFSVFILGLLLCLRLPAPEAQGTGILLFGYATALGLRLPIAGVVFVGRPALFVFSCFFLLILVPKARGTAFSHGTNFDQACIVLVRNRLHQPSGVCF